MRLFSFKYQLQHIASSMPTICEVMSLGEIVGQREVGRYNKGENKKVMSGLGCEKPSLGVGEPYFSLILSANGPRNLPCRASISVASISV